MQNFNTNQTRHFYVAKAIGTETDYNQFDNGDIAIKHNADLNSLWFVFKNYDGLLTRTDAINPKNIVSVKLGSTKANPSSPFKSLARPLLAQEIEIDTSKIIFGATPVLAGTDISLIGKVFDLVVTIHGVFDDDLSNSLPIVASVVGTATNLANSYKLVQEIADALVLAQPKNDPKHPFIRVFYNGNEVTAAAKAVDSGATATKFTIVQGPQAYVRGKLDGTPCLFSSASHLAIGDIEDVQFVKDAVLKPSAISGFTEITGAHQLADLEWFAYGERGDVYRGYLYPNDYDTHYEIDPSGNTDYNVMSVEYFWQGGAENVQKSPRLLEIAAPATVSNDVITELYEALEALIAGVASS